VGERVLIVSSDCHIDFPTGRATDYLESEFHDDFDRWTEELTARMPASLAAVMAATSGSASGLSDATGRSAFTAPVDDDVRLRALEANGVAAEVVIPNPNTIPFMGAPGSRHLPEFDARLQDAGFRAYNRWIAELCDPDRQVGLVVVGYDDIEGAVHEIRKAARTGVRGAYLEGQLRNLPLLFEEYYEPIWSALEEEGMVATFHSGAGLDPEYYAPESAVTMQLMFMEADWYSHRPLWFMIFGGVLERHPALNVAFTEQKSEWVPAALTSLELAWKSRAARNRGLHDTCPRSPREYWDRQCYVGASMLSRVEMPLRHEVGVDHLMYGADFPHPEGHWGKTLEHLQALFGSAEVPDDEARRILGETAARVYRFDAAKLAPVVDRCGFTMDQILTPPSGALEREVERNVGRPFKGW
jgi:predicted TIM-barrel fold metal-dependent hydrolase